MRRDASQAGFFARSLCDFECDQPAEAEQREQRNDSLGDDAIETPDLQDVFFNMGEIEGESEADERGKKEQAAPPQREPAAPAAR